MKIFTTTLGLIARVPRAVSIALVWWLAAACGARAADADASAPSDPVASAVQPGEIAIGEPIPLPSAAGRSDAPASLPPAPSVDLGQPRSLLAGASGDGSVTSEAARGTGWLGLSIAESSEAGRWALAEVAVGGPAAAAGLAVGDEVRAIDGIPIQSADDASQALTAFAPGQRVNLAISRAGQVTDVGLLAVERPVALTSRNWQSSPDPVKSGTPPAVTPITEPPAFATAPPAFAAPEPSAPSVVARAPSRFGAPRTVVEPPSAPAFQPASPTPAALPAPTSPSQTPGRTALGVRTVPIDPGLQARFQLPDAAGAYVIGVVQDLPASKAGVPPGSVIVSLDNRPVRSPDDLTRLVTSGPIGRPVTLQYVLPGGAAHRADVTLQTLEKPLEAALIGPATPAGTPPPHLEPSPSPSTARRPESRQASSVITPLETEIRDLRIRIEQLERRLDAQGGSRHAASASHDAPAPSP